MEGQFLSRRPACQRDAPVLRNATTGGGNQQHLLSLAAEKHARELEGPGAGALSLFHQSLAAYHALQKIEGRRRRDKVFTRDRRRPRRSFGRSSVSTAAKYEKGFAAAGSLPGMFAPD